MSCSYQASHSSQWGDGLVLVPIAELRELSEPVKSRQQASNPQHLAYRASALPVELCRRASISFSQGGPSVGPSLLLQVPCYIRRWLAHHPFEYRRSVYASPRITQPDRTCYEVRSLDPEKVLYLGWAFTISGHGTCLPPRWTPVPYATRPGHTAFSLSVLVRGYAHPSLGSGLEKSVRRWGPHRTVVR